MKKEDTGTNEKKQEETGRSRKKQQELIQKKLEETGRNRKKNWKKQKKMCGIVPKICGMVPKTCGMGKSCSKKSAVAVLSRGAHAVCRTRPAMSCLQTMTYVLIKDRNRLSIFP